MLSRTSRGLKAGLDRKAKKDPVRMGNVWHPGAFKQRTAPKQQQHHVSWRGRRDFFPAQTQALTIPMKAALNKVHRGCALWTLIPLKETTLCLSNTNAVLQLWLAIHYTFLALYFGVHLTQKMKLFSYWIWILQSPCKWVYVISACYVS